MKIYTIGFTQKPAKRFFELIKEHNINILLDIKIRSNSNNSFKFANCIFTVEEVKKRLRANSNYDMSIDYLLMNMWKEINGERSSRY